MLCKIIGAHVVKNLLKTAESHVVYLGIQNDNSKSTFLMKYAAYVLWRIKSPNSFDDLITI